MALPDRWAGQRGAWVLSRAGRHLGARRRGERLVARGRATERSLAGVGSMAATETQTRGWFWRTVTREPGVANTVGWFAWACYALTMTALLIGPGIALAWVVYGIWFLGIDRFGPLRSAPIAVAGGGLSMVYVAMAYFLTPSNLQMWIGLQVVFAAFYVAWLVRAYGWPEVSCESPTRAKKPKPRNVVATSAPATVEAAQPEHETTASEPIEDVPVIRRRLGPSTRQGAPADGVDVVEEPTVEVEQASEPVEERTVVKRVYGFAPVRRDESDATDETDDEVDDLSASDEEPPADLYEDEVDELDVSGVADESDVPVIRRAGVAR